MEIFHKVVLVTTFAMGTSASPINFVQTRSGSTCLTVLLTLFLFLLLLIVIKHVFIKNRRAPPLTSGCSLTFNTSLQSSTLGLLPGAGIRRISIDEKAAILVGLLGSPSRETGAEARNISLSYQTCACSRSADQPTTLRSSPSIAQPRPVSMVKSSACEMRALCDVRGVTGLGQRKTQSLRLLAYPSRTYVGFRDFRMARRFSLPTIREAHPSYMHQKNISKLVSSRIRLYNTLETSPLADSPLTPLVSGDSPNRLLFSSPKCGRSSSSQVAQESGTPRSNLDLKICHSQFSPSPPHTPETSTKDFVTTSLSPLRPSQSYALAPHNPQNTHILSCSNEMPHTQASYVTDDCIRSLQPALMPKAKFQTPITRVPLTRVTSSINCSPLILQTTSTGPFYHSSLSSHLASNSSSPPKVTYKQNIPPLRARRSPVIGPSPLRSMILPDPSDSNTTIQAISTGNEITKASPFDRRPSFYASLSMNSPLTNLSVVPEDRIDNPIGAIAVADEEWKNQGCGDNRRSAQVEDEDPNIILQIIRELVEETNSWDASLFVDENFKMMIKDSGLPPSHRVLDDHKSASTDLLCDSFEEVDIGNTGIDIPRSDGETFILAENVPGDYGGVKMATLWDGRDWVKFGNKCDEVGLAW